MSDSDETVCDTEDFNESQMSPSIIVPESRINVTGKDLCGSEKARDVGSSPEFLPPSAKIKRLEKEDDKDTRALNLEQVLTMVSKREITPEEKLNSIKNQEDTIEELLVFLELKAKKGIATKEDPVFAQVKALMTTVKTQLADLNKYQQQQRQELAKAGEEVRRNRVSIGSQWNSETKQKLIELAAQQKMLLKLFKRHKHLLEKIQALKQKPKEAGCTTANILPSVEMHWKSQKEVNVQKDSRSKQILPPHVTARGISLTRSVSPYGVTTNESTSSSTSILLPIHSQPTTTKGSMLSASSTIQHAPPSVVARRVSSISSSKQAQLGLNTLQALSTASQDIPPPVASCVSSISSTKQAQFTPNTSHISGVSNSSQDIPPPVASSVSSISSTNQALFTPNTAAYISTVSQPLTSVVSSVSSINQSQSTLNNSQAICTLTTSQPVVQRVNLTGAQLYQIGGRQIYVLPQGVGASVIPPAQTQLSTSQHIAAPHNSIQMPSLSSLHSSQQKNSIISSSTKSSLPSEITPTHVNMDVQPQQGTCQTVPTTSSSLWKGSVSGLSYSQLSGRSDKQKTNQLVKSTAVPQMSATITHLTSQLPLYHAPSLVGPVSISQTLSQAGRTSVTYTSNAPILQSKGGQSLQRRNSFGSDLPDLKSLINHNIIQAGNNVLTVHFEGRKFEASLRTNGLIESTGGETFRTPMAWMRAVRGSWSSIRPSQAYKMVHYEGKPLAMFTLPPTDKESRDSNRVQSTAGLEIPCELPSTLGQNTTVSPAIRIQRQGGGNGLIASWDDLAQLLTDCRVVPIGNNELTPTNSFLPANFWDSASDWDIPASVLEGLDF